ncbi:MAG: sugar ABC transporter permease [Erysipelotrichaceae bacterium]|nr:sugar ABC transporter permease [Erysipelotrichaceae bacterium]MDP3305616.1 sugar ABC transporter permease [Erysipelotrichaceae bacterium]
MKKSNRSLTLFILPALLFYAIFTLAPAFGGIWYSFTNWNGLNPNYELIGFRNFEVLLKDKNFFNSIWFTVKFVGIMVVLQNIIALSLAVLIETRFKTKTLFRTLVFMPNMISMIIGGFMWMFIFTRALPTIANLLNIAALDISWLGDPTFSFIAIIIVSLWGGVGYLMIIYMAALQGVAKNLREAAMIDGANAWQVFKNITIPSIMPAITIGVFVTLNNSFKVFDVVYSLTGGGPGRSTQVIAMNIFEEAYSMNNRFGYASAKSLILFVIILVITLIQLSIMRKKEVN